MRTTSRPIHAVCLASMTLLLLASAFLGCKDEQGQQGSELRVQKRSVSPLAQEYLRQGILALRQQDFQAALVQADRAERYAPADANFLRGQVLIEMLRLEEAAAAFRKVLDLEPDYHGAWHYMGNAAFRAAEFDLALVLYRNELDEHPSPASWRGMGRAYLELGRVDSARYALEQAVAADRTYSDAYFDLSRLLEDEGEPQTALSYAQNALRSEPKNPLYRYKVGSLLVKTGRGEEALPFLRAVVEQWPWHFESHFNIGQALLQLGQEAEAKVHLAEAERLRELQLDINNVKNATRTAPKDPVAHATLGAALHRAGRFEEAMHAYKVAAYLDPQNLDVQNNIANLHLVAGDAAAAINLYREILKEDSAQVSTWVNLGIAYALSENLAAAQEAWQRALEHDPDHQAAKSHLARLKAR